MGKQRIGIVGDFRGSAAQVATAVALEHAASVLEVEIEVEWIATSMLTHNGDRIRACSGLFIAPGSPYADMEAVLEVIRDARVAGVPLLGTCGGFQHLVLELARNVLGVRAAQHAEYEPNAADLVIAPLACSLVGQRAEVFVQAGSTAATLYAAQSSVEEYRCSFGLARAYESALSTAGLVISGRDGAGEARIVELDDHPFFVGTLFVPQLSSRAGEPHPLIVGFLAKASGRPTVALR